ncbi:hypothetical protein MNBD_GAMMA11-2652 [hydrothermal vent metagenome]|uniref:Uncharacterized protein n=1 Tax=hydrothermal vent metagenome TaxID=652676 RepID=A0A3B0WU10_9ZZZZ
MRYEPDILISWKERIATIEKRQPHGCRYRAYRDGFTATFQLWLSFLLVSVISTTRHTAYKNPSTDFVSATDTIYINTTIPDSQAMIRTGFGLPGLSASMPKKIYNNRASIFAISQLFSATDNCKVYNINSAVVNSSVSTICGKIFTPRFFSLCAKLIIKIPRTKKPLNESIAHVTCINLSHSKTTTPP